MQTVFIVSLANGYGGAERNVELIAEHLQSEKQIVVFAENPLHIDALKKRLRTPSKVVQLCRSDRRDWYVRQLLKLCAYLIALRPKVVIANSERSALVLYSAARLLRLFRCRLFIFVQDFLWKNLGAILRQFPKAHLLTLNEAVLEPPDYLRPFVAPHGPFSCTLVPAMVGINGSSTDGDYVLHLATINPWKGHVHLIRAAALLNRSGRPLPVISCGPDGAPGLAYDLRQMIHQFGLDEHYLLRDYVEDPSDLLKKCLCVVVPSVSHSGGPETFGRTIIEAWSYRKPVVAFATGAPRYLIEHEVDGLLVPEADEAALANALWRLRTDANLCRHLGENGFAKVKQRFTIEQVCRDFASVLDGQVASTRSFEPIGKRYSASDAPLDLKADNSEAWRKPGRNAPCPCGSGKKYKHCHGQLV